MKKSLLISLLIVFFTSTQAQITFQKTFGGSGANVPYSVQQTTDGGYIITGYTSDFGAGGGDVILIKTDAYGDTLWTKTYGDSLAQIGHSVKQTKDGGYIVAGRTWIFGDGNYDVYLIKTDAAGDLLWTRSIGGPGEDFSKSVQQTLDGGYIIAGYTRSGYGSGGTDIYLIKVDSTGADQWTKVFGGAQHDDGTSVQETYDGGFIITGGISSVTGGYSKVYLIRTDINGNIIWAKTYGGTSVDRGHFVQQTSDGGYIITGSTSSFGVAAIDVYLIRTDANGNTLWSKTFGGAGVDIGYSVQQTTDNSYFITGYTNSFGAGNYDIYLIKADSMGNMLWSKTFGGALQDGGWGLGNFGQLTADGGQIMTGYTESFGAGGLDIYLIKTDANGNSGCNEITPNTISGNVLTEVDSLGIATYSGGIGNNTASIVNNTAINDSTLCFAVGMEEAASTLQSSASVEVYPNPTSGRLTLEMYLQEKTTVNIKLYHFTGQLIHSEEIGNVLGSYTQQMDLNGYAKGMYYIHIMTDKGVVTKKVICQ